MDRSTEGLTTRHFACTRCGACCNRAPELELGESAVFADTFVLQLMMRIYSLPRGLADYQSSLPRAEAGAEYFESKRMLGQFAATSWNARVRRGERVVEYVQYLSLSVLPLDLGFGACPALVGGTCGIYDGRPLSCRSVPLHYSRPAATASRDLDVFAASPGYLCDTGKDAPVVIAKGEVVDPAMRAARAQAQDQAKADTNWKAALIKAMKAQQYGLPSPRTVESNAALGALSASMLPAWRVAQDAGLIPADEVQDLLLAQRGLIERELQRPDLPPGTAQSLLGLSREYAAARGS